MGCAVRRKKKAESAGKFRYILAAIGYIRRDPHANGFPPVRADIHRCVRRAAGAARGIMAIASMKPLLARRRNLPGRDVRMRMGRAAMLTLRGDDAILPERGDAMGRDHHGAASAAA